jgi:hypothetical protein
MKKEGQIKITARSCYGHLGGKLGNRLFERLVELGWFEREQDKVTVFRITETGYEQLARLGVRLE